MSPRYARVLALGFSVLLALATAREANAVDRPTTCLDLEEMIGNLTAADLGHDPQWLRLGHYRKRFLGGWASEVDGPTFFLAVSGKSDPVAELEATVRALCAPPEPETPELHASCVFPARARWLRETLGLVEGALPEVQCTARDDFLRRLNPDSVALIFSSYYLNNPVSAFGHTFLKIKSKDSSKFQSRQELLDYGIDYAAVTGDENAVLYAFKGLFGLFEGRFSAMPYFYKVRKYNDIEARDIWQYDLNLSPDQSLFLAEHLWELGRTYLDYWYLDENCSYHILGAIETVEPTTQLTESLSFPVLPSNTVKALVNQPGLVRDVVYRPSIRSQFRARLRGLEGQDRKLVSLLLEDPDIELPAQYPKRRTAQILDAAIDLVEMRYFRELVKDPGGPASQLKQSLLARRAAVAVTSQELTPPPPVDEMPHLGHGSRRAGLGLGTSEEEGEFVSLRWRLAMHDLLDPPTGYPKTAAIEFLPVELRVYPGDGDVHLEELYAVRVLSLAPLDEFETSLSWKFGVGATTIRDEGCSGECTAAHAGAGAGVAGALRQGTLLAFMMWDADLLATPRLEGGVGGGNFRVGLGPSAGLRYRPLPTWAVLAKTKWSFLPGQDPDHTWKAGIETEWSLGRDVTLGLQAEKTPEDLVGTLYTSYYF